jgi:hypothetical protein
VGEFSHLAALRLQILLLNYHVDYADNTVTRLPRHNSRQRSEQRWSLFFSIAFAKATLGTSIVKAW